MYINIYIYVCVCTYKALSETTSSMEIPELKPWFLQKDLGMIVYK